LFTVALAGMGLVSVAQFWHTACLRDKEQDLIFAGNQFRAAIGRYYERNAGAADQFPKTLEALLGDPHAPVTLRYLRRIYPDPFTGKAEWGLIKTPSGSIMGVYSLAPGIPVKQAQFAPQDAQFAGAQAYSDWKFVYAGSATAQVPGMSPSLPRRRLHRRRPIRRARPPPRLPRPCCPNPRNGSALVRRSRSAMRSSARIRRAASAPMAIAWILQQRVCAPAKQEADCRRSTSAFGELPGSRSL